MAIEFGMLEPGSVKFNVSGALDIYMQLPKDLQTILSGMARGCLHKTKRIKDPEELTYQMNACSKRNDNEVCIILFFFYPKMDCFYLEEIYSCFFLFLFYSIITFIIEYVMRR